MRSSWRALSRIAGAVLLATFSTLPAFSQNLADVEKVGKFIFFDLNLSINRNQSCASCHAPEAGWTGPTSFINAHGAVYEGSIPARFGDRKPPSSAYATQSPIFHQDKKGLFLGGSFWDGRATGAKLGNPAADQAQGPFLNRKEQALPDSACVVYRVCTAAYPVTFTSLWPNACNIAWPANIESTCGIEGAAIGLSPADRNTSNLAYDLIALAIAKYEASPEVNAFSSKYDHSFGGKVQLNQLERRGFALFMGQGKCSRCHTAGPRALFTDYSYDNLGIPKNPENPVYAEQPAFVDPGLGGFLKSAGYPMAVYMTEMGKFKVPTLRNVDKGSSLGIVKAFGHNGYFKSLAGIVNFYNTRDVKPRCASPMTSEAMALAQGCWPAPEYAGNINTAELGNLGLSPADEAAIVAFLKTLSDGYIP